MKRQFNKKRWNPQGLKVGDNVWLENKNIQLNQPSKKLDNKRYRPFRISKDIGSGAFLLQIRYSLVVILGLNSVSGVQYKGMMIDR